MANAIKERFLKGLKKRFGNIRKLDDSLSLFDIGNGAGRVYIRYSKVHPRGQTFYGLRQKDLQKLEGMPSVICFLWQDQKAPIILPYSDFEEVFHSLTPASDGQ